MKLRRYTCNTVRKMLPLHTGRDLDPVHVGAVDEHLESCLPCFREFRELAAMRSRLGVLAEEPLPEGILDGFTEEVMARIDIREPGPAAEVPHKAPLLRFQWPRVAAAAALVLVSIAVWQLVDVQDPGVLRGARGPDIGPSAGTVVRDGAATPQGPGNILFFMPGQGVVRPVTQQDLDMFESGGAVAVEHAMRLSGPVDTATKAASDASAVPESAKPRRR